MTNHKDRKERPIIFGSPMVRAILAGTKSQTRRVVAFNNSTALGYTSKHIWAQLHHWEHAWVDGPPDPIGGGCGYQYLHVPATGSAGVVVTDNRDDWCWYRVRPRMEPGDRLWVREKWRALGSAQRLDDDGILRDRPTSKDECVYATDEPSDNGPWRPSIHMPRLASRITLVVKAVRVERVQDISEADAIAEGMTPTWGGESSPGVKCASETDQYADLWDKINGEGSWAANPYVWVIEFERVKP